MYGKIFFYIFKGTYISRIEIKKNRIIIINLINPYEIKFYDYYISNIEILLTKRYIKYDVFKTKIKFNLQSFC